MASQVGISGQPESRGHRNAFRCGVVPVSLRAHARPASAWAIVASVLRDEAIGRDGTVVNLRTGSA